MDVDAPPSRPLPDDPPIEPTDWDVIVLGTGLGECLVASATARAGKSVLQLDAAPRFGGPWATLNLDELVAWVRGAGGGGPPPAPCASTAPAPAPPSPPPSDDGGDGRAILLPRPRHTALPGASLLIPHKDKLGPPRSYALDLAPAPLYAAGPAVAALLAAGAGPYTEFRLAGPGYVYEGGGVKGLAPVPAGRADVFRDARLGLAEKRGVMRFLSSVADGLGAGGCAPASGPLAAPLHSPSTPLAAIVAAAGLPRAVADAVVYGLAGADADQGAWEGREVVVEGGEGDGRPPSPPPPIPSPPAWAAAPLTGRDGGRALSLYLASLGRYGPGGALLAPVHGCGELPQAFARSAAVAGGCAALRRAVVSVELDGGGGGGGGDDDGAPLRASAVRLASGQRLTCRALAAAEEALAGVGGAEWGGREGVALFPPAGPASDDAPPPAVSRAIAILDGPVQPAQAAGSIPAPPSPDGTTAVLVLPPRCLAAGGAGGGGHAGTAPGFPPHAVRGLQVGSPTAACPPGQVVLYLSTPATSRAGPEADLRPALAALARLDGGEAAAEAGGENAATRPSVLFAAFYREPGPAGGEAATDGLPANVALLPPPTGALSAAAAAVADAGRALARLWPDGSVSLFPTVAAPAAAAAAAEAAAPIEVDDGSDEEAAASLAAALAAMDAGDDDEK